MIFQALGARYGFGAAVKHAFARGTEADSEKLRQALVKRYGGEAVLYQKGRAALAAAVRLATNGQGGKVAISGLTCYSVVQAVEAADCTPVFVDIRESDLQFGAKELEAAIKKHADIKAVVVQNMLGIPADIAAIQKLADKTGIVIIEDLAHSAGAQYADGREVGTVGDITMLSFGRDKAIDSVNGGALVVRNHKNPLAFPVIMPSSSWQFRDHIYPLIAWLTRVLYPVKLGRYVMGASIKAGLVVRSADGEVDETLCLPHWQAKLAHEQVTSLTTAAVRRRQKAQEYQALVKHLLPSGMGQAGEAPVRVPLVVDNRDEVVSHLGTRGVQVNDIWYDVPVSPQRFYDRVHYPVGECPNAVRIAAKLVNLPTHGRISNADIEYISKLVREVARA